MNIEKMKEVFADEAFVSSLRKLKTAAEVQAALKEKDIEVTEEQVVAIGKLIEKLESGEISKEQLKEMAVRAESGELTEEDLENVAGGLAFLAFGAVILIASALGLCAIGPSTNNS